MACLDPIRAAICPSPGERNPRDLREGSEPLAIALIAISESLLSEDTGSRVRWNEP
jgi:hypothetical protein